MNSSASLFLPFPHPVLARHNGPLIPGGLVVKSQVALGRVLPTPAPRCGVEVLFFILCLPGPKKKSQACYDGEQLTFGTGVDPGELSACHTRRCGDRKGEDTRASVSSTVQVWKVLSGSWIAVPVLYSWSQDLVFIITCLHRKTSNASMYAISKMVTCIPVLQFLH